MKKLALALIAALIIAAPASARERSQAAKNAFKAAHPCPANGHTSGPCPGYIIDHITALACGGADDPSNMQWQTEQAAHDKDKWERNGCGTSSGTHSNGSTAHNHSNGGSSQYTRGPRGGCYTITSSGRKNYVSRDLCN